MSRFFPSLSPTSLAGRMVILFVLALSAAQAVNFFVLARQKQAAIITEITKDGIQRFVEAAAKPSRKHLSRFEMAMPPHARGVVWLDDRSSFSDKFLYRDTALEHRLRLALKQRGVDVSDVAASYQPRRPPWPHPPPLNGPPAPFGAHPPPPFGAPPPPPPFGAPPPPFGPHPPPFLGARPPHPPGAFPMSPRNGQMRGQGKFPRRVRMPPPFAVSLSVLLAGSTQWLNGEFPANPPPPPVRASDFLVSAALIVAFACLAIVAFSLQLAKPLRDLSAATKRVGAIGENENVPLRGPREVRDAVKAFNEMNRRVTNLLNEKDVMLGALGHDLRTPLTSLRLRVEQMEPEETRQRAIETLDETAALLADILEFARSGRSEETASRYDVGSIVADAVADYQERGENVSLEQKGRVVAICKPASIRRMVHNLVDNAVKYAGAAHVSLLERDNTVFLAVEDEGAGIPEDTIDAVLRPFQRGKNSRSRATGGTGLGLAIAHAIAAAHGGELRLENKTPKGLRVQVRFPSAVEWQGSRLVKPAQGASGKYNGVSPHSGLVERQT